MVTNWIEKPLSELFDFSGGLSASRADLSTIGHPYLHYGDIHGSKSTFVDVCIDNSIPRLNVDLTKVSKGSLLSDGDVVFVDASEDDEGASRHLVVRNEKNAPFISGLHTIVAKAKTNELDNLFKEFCFQTAAIKAQFKFYAVGTKVTGISKTAIGKILLSYPQDTAEQRRIAAALSDTDALITALERLIAKKRAVKKGAMQELLTGKRRLPGFKGEWVEKKLESLVISAKSGGTPLTSVASYYDGYVPFLSINDMTVQGKYLRYASNKISQDGLDNSASWVVPVDSLIYSMYASVGFVSIAKIPLAISQAVLCLEVNGDNDTEFLYYLLSFIQPNVFKYVGEGTQKNLNAKAVRNFELFLPPTMTEQTAIAEILSDMDAEIDKLTAKLSKLRGIKQGMMSELLTGRIRLVEQDAVTITEISNAATGRE